MCSVCQVLSFFSCLFFSTYPQDGTFTKYLSARRILKTVSQKNPVRQVILSQFYWWEFWNSEKIHELFKVKLLKCYMHSLPPPVCCCCMSPGLRSHCSHSALCSPWEPRTLSHQQVGEAPPILSTWSSTRNFGKKSQQAGGWIRGQPRLHSGTWCKK